MKEVTGFDKVVQALIRREQLFLCECTAAFGRGEITGVEFDRFAENYHNDVGEFNKAQNLDDLVNVFGGMNIDCGVAYDLIFKITLDLLDLFQVRILKQK